MSTSPKPLPLEGIRVLDFGQFVAIPFCTLWLGQLGAEIISIESSSRLTARGAPPFEEGQEGNRNASGYFNSLYATKKSLTLDLATQEGKRIVHELVAVCDVVVENFATGVIEKLGFGYDVLARINPGIVMISNGAFGRTGPMKDGRGLHSTVNLFSGVADVTGYVDSGPRIMGSVLPDPLSGIYAAFAILAALEHRTHTGLGQYVDVAMYEAMLTLIPEAVIDLTMNGVEPRRVGNRDRQKAPHGIYPAAGEDRWLALSIADDQSWQAFCNVVGRTDLASDARFANAPARLKNVEALDAEVASCTSAHDLYEMVVQLQTAGVMAGPVLRSDELLDNPQLDARGMVVSIDHPVANRHRHLGLPWTMDSLGTRSTRAPLLGEHSREIIIGLLGRTEAEYEQMERDRILT